MENERYAELIRLKKEKNAIILAHYYAPREAQEVADFVGDSFYLAKVASTSDADVIVLCGVSFMGESAKLINPKKCVVMPDVSADCPMAHMVDVEKIHRLRAEYPDLTVVCYVNSTAAIKAQSDVCVTSSNAVRIVRALPGKNIFFIPDKNLGAFVKASVPEKNIILNDGCCPIHAAISIDELTALKKAHPNAEVLTHPECEDEILAVSDYIGSTADIIKYAGESAAGEFIVCTEEGVEYRLTSDNPDKKFYFPMTRPVCCDMKRNTLRGIVEALRDTDGSHEVSIDSEVALRACLPLMKMLELGK